MLNRLSVPIVRNCLKLFPKFQKNCSSKINEKRRRKEESAENMSVVLCAKQDLKLEPRPMPEIGPRGKIFEILLKKKKKTKYFFKLSLIRCPIGNGLRWYLRYRY